MHRLGRCLAAPSFRSTPYSHYYPKCIGSGRIRCSRGPKFQPRPVNGMERTVIERLERRGGRFFVGREMDREGEREREATVRATPRPRELHRAFEGSGNHSFLPLSVMASWSLKPALPTALPLAVVHLLVGGPPSGPVELGEARSRSPSSPRHAPLPCLRSFRVQPVS